MTGQINGRCVRPPQELAGALEVAAIRQAAEKATAPLGGPAKGKGKERGKGREEEGEGKERGWIQVACKDATVLKRAAGELKVGAQAHTRMCVCVCGCACLCV